MRRISAVVLLVLVSCHFGDGQDYPINFGGEVVGYKELAWPCDAFIAYGFDFESPFTSPGWYVDVFGAPRFWLGGPFHRGIDMVALTDDYRVFSAGAGTARTYSASDGHGYGNRVVVDHGDGYHTLYAHLSIIGVTDGPVLSGQHLGTMGRTGNASGGIHLHFEVRHEPSGSIAHWQRHCPGGEFDLVEKGAAIGGYFPVYGP